MTSEFIKDGDANGTEFQGNVTTTYAELERVFGQPDNGPNDHGDKVTCEWVITFSDGSVATIYDWKVYGPTPTERFTWNIGGFNRKVVGLVERALGLHPI